MLGRISVGSYLQRELREERLKDQTKNMDVASD